MRLLCCLNQQIYKLCNKISLKLFSKMLMVLKIDFYKIKLHLHYLRVSHYITDLTINTPFQFFRFCKDLSQGKTFRYFLPSFRKNCVFQRRSSISYTTNYSKLDVFIILSANIDEFCTNPWHCFYVFQWNAYLIATPGFPIKLMCLSH